MEAAEPKRKRSEDGLLGLLGTYASDEDEAEGAASASPKKQRADAGGAAEPTSPRETSEEPLADISAVLAAASAREAAAAAAAAADVTMAEAEPDAPGEAAQQQDPVAAAAAEDAEAFALPPELAEPPEARCPPEVQAKVSEYLRKQEETGTTISSALRSLSGYRNPDFLQHCVIYDKISEYGSCYPPDKFDPHTLPPEDNYKRLAQEWQAFAERQRSERQRGQGIEFARGGSETLGRSAAAGLNASSVAANIVAQAKAAAAAGQRASKWDAAKR